MKNASDGLRIKCLYTEGSLRPIFVGPPLLVVLEYVTNSQWCSSGRPAYECTPHPKPLRVPVLPSLRTYALKPPSLTYRHVRENSVATIAPYSPVHPPGCAFVLSPTLLMWNSEGGKQRMVWDGDVYNIQPLVWVTIEKVFFTFVWKDYKRLARWVFGL